MATKKKQPNKPCREKTGMNMKKPKPLGKCGTDGKKKKQK